MTGWMAAEVFAVIANIKWSSRQALGELPASGAHESTDPGLAIGWMIDNVAKKPERDHK